MTSRRTTIRGAAVTAAVAAILAGGGCGGDDGDPTASVRSVSSTPGELPRTVGGDGKARTRGEAGKPTPRGRAAVKKQLAKRFEQVAKRLPPRRRVRLATQVTEAVMNRYGFRSARASATGGGWGVRVTIPAGEACTAQARDERVLVDAVRDGVPWLRSVQVVAGEGGQPLSSYVRRSCRPLTLPGGRGPVVLTQRGSSLQRTKLFTIRSRRWTIEYVNLSGFLRVHLGKDGAPTGTQFYTAKRGVGRWVASGPGRFGLNVTSLGPWTIRVRDGA
jgi:hypothetical protein